MKRLLNSPSAAQAGNDPSSSDSLLLVFLASIVLSVFAISPQSLWIDEANTAAKAVQPTWAAFTQLMSIERGSDIQMPGYMALLWGWEKLVGHSEYALRALNVLWLLGAQVAFCFLLRAPTSARFFSAATALVSSFVWYYLDEARPYAMQLCGASWVAVSIWNRSFYPTLETIFRDVAVFCAGAAVLCASSLLGVVHTAILGMLFLIMLTYSRPPISLLRSGRLWVVLVTTMVFMAVLGGYYVWTLGLGAKASMVGRTSLATIGFSLYELLGYSGFGPGRLQLREAGPSTLIPYAGWLLLPCLPYGAVFLWLLTKKQGGGAPRIPVVLVGGFVLLAFAGISAVGFLGHFRVLGRHLMPLAPFLILTLGTCYAGMWRSTNLLWRAVVVASLAIFLGGSVSGRFSPRFAKDDYRSAAAEALSAMAGGKAVWWAADGAGARYYGVFPREPEDRGAPVGSAFFANNPKLDYQKNLPAPDLIVLSKVDIFDPAGDIRQWMNENNFVIAKVFPAFTIWKKTSTALSPMGGVTPRNEAAVPHNVEAGAVGK